MALVKKKIVLLGDGAVGKTSLIRKFVTDRFSDDYIVTIGTKVTKKELKVDSRELNLMIWDVLGQQGYTSTQAMSFQGCTGALVVADVTRAETLDSVSDYWIPRLEAVTGRIPYVFLANKADLADRYAFGPGELDSLAEQYGAASMLTSAKSGLNVENSFLALGQSLLSGMAPAQAPAARNAAVTGARDLSSIRDLIGATDAVIEDFCAHFGDREQAMPILRQQFATVDVDIRSPTADGLKEVVKKLELVEKDLKGEEAARDNRKRRYKIINAVG